MACAAFDREPARSVGDLNQAMVVAKPNHRGDWKLQHLIGRAAPNAAEHGQKVPIAKLGTETMLLQKISQRLA